MNTFLRKVIERKGRFDRKINTFLRKIIERKRRFDRKINFRKNNRTKRTIRSKCKINSLLRKVIENDNSIETINILDIHFYEELSNDNSIETINTLDIHFYEELSNEKDDLIETCINAIKYIYTNIFLRKVIARKGRFDQNIK